MSPERKLDFTYFHPTGDHWPFTRYCRQYYGGGWRHLRLAWEYRWADELRYPLCWFGRHKWQTWTRSCGGGVGPPEGSQFTICASCGKDRP